MTAAEPGAAALEPTRVHLRQAAAARAARIRADAHHSAGRIREQARLAAAATVEQARADGHAEAAPLAAAELSRGRDAAARGLLRARSEAYDELRRQVRAAVGALPGKPGYDHLARRIAALARSAAGPGAVVTAVPAGGWLARAPGVTVDCSLTRLADLAVEALGAEIQGLWTP
jgi:vacuolar-type H+-ATPase subunit E/Vma4